MIGKLRRIRWWEWLSLVVSMTLAAMYPYKRWAAAAGDPYHVDFSTFFRPAAQAVLVGTSPYTVAGYVHPPLTAGVIALLEMITSNPGAWWLGLQAIAGFAGLGLAVAALTRDLSIVHRSLVLTAASFTLWATRPAMRVFFLGQSDLLILMAIGAALVLIRRHAFWSGFALGFPAMVKLWPAIFGFWLLSGSSRRRRLGGFILMGLLTLALTTCLGGWRGTWDLLRAAYTNSNQGLISYSATGVGEALFTNESDLVVSLSTSPVGHWMTAALLGLWLVGLLVLALWKVRDPAVSFMLVVAVTVLLITVSQFTYQIYSLPLLWYWAARCLRTPKDPWVWTASAVGAVWWYLFFFRIPEVDHFNGNNPVLTAQAFLLQFGACLTMVTASVVFELVRPNPAGMGQPRPRPMPWGRRSGPQPSNVSA